VAARSACPPLRGVRDRDHLLFLLPSEPPRLPWRLDGPAAFDEPNRARRPRAASRGGRRQRHPRLVPAPTTGPREGAVSTRHGNGMNLKRLARADALLREQLGRASHLRLPRLSANRPARRRKGAMPPSTRPTTGWWTRRRCRPGEIIHVGVVDGRRLRDGQAARRHAGCWCDQRVTSFPEAHSITTRCLPARWLVSTVGLAGQDRDGGGTGAGRPRAGPTASCRSGWVSGCTSGLRAEALLFLDDHRTPTDDAGVFRRGFFAGAAGETRR